MLQLKQVQPRVFVATSTLYKTNTIIIQGAGHRCLVVDPGVTVQEIATLTREIALWGYRVDAGFSTHPHWDHLLWSKEWKQAPRFAARACVEVAQAQRSALVEELTREAPGHPLELFASLSPLPEGSHELFWHGPAARVLTHNGHAPGHSALFFPDLGLLLAGDMVSDVEVPLLDLRASNPIRDYRDGLKMLANLAGVRMVIPGHGHIADANEYRRRLNADRQYLADLENMRESADPRLTAAWLHQQHREQVEWVRSRNSPTP